MADCQCPLAQHSLFADGQLWTYHPCSAGFGNSQFPTARPQQSFPLGILLHSVLIGPGTFLLTINNAIGIVYLRSKYTTSEAAKIVGIHLATLQRWIARGKVKAPKPTLIGAVGYRLWSQDDIAELRELKKAIYCKGRGRKRQSQP